MQCLASPLFQALLPMVITQFKIQYIMSKTISFNELRRLKDSLPDGATHRIADELNLTVQTVRNYFGGVNYQFGNNHGLHIEPGPDGGIVVLDDTTIYDMACKILEEENAKA